MSVTVYARLLARVLAWTRSMLAWAVKRDANAQIVLDIVNRAASVSWALACAYLDSVARSHGHAGSVLPSPTMFTLPQVTALLNADPDVSVRNLVWALRNSQRGNVRRSVTGDGGLSGRELMVVTAARRAQAQQLLLGGDSVKLTPSELADELASFKRIDEGIQAALAELEPDEFVYEVDVVPASSLRQKEPSEYDKQAGRVVQRDGKWVRPVGWARVIRGEYTCGFCIMLASRGAVYRSRVTAAAVRKKKLQARSGMSAMDDLDASFHYHCDCEVVPVFNLDGWEGKEQADALYDLWKQGPGNVEDFNTWIKEKYASGWKPERSMSVFSDTSPDLAGKLD